MTRSYGYMQIIGGPRSNDFPDPAMASLQACGEADTYTCGHCQKVVIIKPGGKNDDGVCRHCWALVCPKCAGEQRCKPIEAQIEEKLRKKGF